MSISRLLTLHSLLIFSTLFTLWFSCCSTTSIVEESKGLLKWKDTIHVETNSPLSSWVLPPAGHVNTTFYHCHNWHRVSCNDLGRVRELDLSRIGLEGMLRAFPFSFLPYLDGLDMSFNNLSGPIPVQVANLSQLKQLNFSNNHFFGNMPSEFGNLTQLSFLYLQMNQLSGPIPPELGKLRALTEVSLRSNNFIGWLPSSLGNLTNLKLLYLYETQIAGTIPSELGNLKSLTLLALYNNKLTGSIPSSLGNLTNLNILYLYTNQLSGPIPSELGNLKSLIKLTFSGNQLSGSIPAEIGNLRFLQTLKLFDNQLSGSIPSELGFLTSLTVLYLDNNTLTGMIPSSLANLHNLSILGLSSNNLSGPFPREMSNLRFTTLSLSKNHLSGPLPHLPCNGGKLEILSVNSNHFTGPILESLRNCSSLLRLRLEDNKLTGDISGAFGIYPKLNYVNLSNNHFSGELSDNWGQFKNLTSFTISRNHITGQIPPGFGSSLKLGHLDLSSNQLIGNIQKELGSLPSLFKLDLHDNKLSGHLSKDLFKSRSLQYLDLSVNNLSGLIPKEIGDSASLLSLNLGNNKFSGRIPAELANLGQLSIFLDLSQNLLTGGIPLEFGKLKLLTSLDLSHNMINGSIPQSFEGMLSLVDINVSYNLLEGPVPHTKLFRESPAGAFTHNKGLCGDIKVLQPCSTKSPSSKRKHGMTLTAILLCLIGGILFLTFSSVGIYLKLCKSKRSTGEDTRALETADVFQVWNFDGKFVNENIIEATEGFDNKYCIGEGSSGNVYKAVLSTGQVVAVKKFHPSHDGEAINLKSFETELEALKNLRHRHIVKLYGFCSHLRHSYLIYEYLEHGSLAKTLNNVDQASSLDWTERVKIIRSVADALAYMHHGCLPPLIHRDISAKNILLDLEYNAYVADFGISRVLTANSTNWTEPAGTYGYLAPELAYTMRLTSKSDVYSFGVLSLEVIMGSHPGEFISFFATTSSSSQIDILLVDILDKRIQNPTPEMFKEISFIAKMAFLCLDSNPGFRPTSEFVSQKLFTHQPSLMVSLSTTTIGQLCG